MARQAYRTQTADQQRCQRLQKLLPSLPARRPLSPQLVFLTVFLAKKCRILFCASASFQIQSTPEMLILESGAMGGEVKSPFSKIAGGGGSFLSQT